MKEKLAASPRLRVALMCALAFIVYGGWAFAVNFGHGLPVASTAGLAQGISSTISTLIIASIIELCFQWFRGRPGGLLLAWLVPPTLTGLMHAAFQWVVGTPNVLLTVLFSVVMGYVFAGVYLRGVVRLTSSPASSA